MCGLAGFISSQNKSFESATAILNDMVQSIAHRGPDCSGLWVSADSKVALGHRRLAILDVTSAGNQPMPSAHEKYLIIFNGEIYNSAELREFLSKNIGYSEIKWRGHSDTEVFVNLMEFVGIEAAVKMAVGMFAFAAWCPNENVLTLGRDRAGEKPLYYGWDDGVFIFASELKAIKKHPKFRLEISRESVFQFMQLGYVPAPLSIYSQIFKLNPGHLLRINSNGMEISNKAYWKLGFDEVSSKSNLTAATDTLENLLCDGISRQMTADVPVGAFLSGGIDSSLVCALMQKTSNRPIKTFTIAFNEMQYDESDYAKKIAEAIGAENECIYLTGENALDIVSKISSVYDEPFADSSQIPTILLALYASESVKVVLTGDGGDELFGGYNRHIGAHYHLHKIFTAPYAVRRQISSIMSMIGVSSVDTAYKILRMLSLKFRGPIEFIDRYRKLARCIGARDPEDLYLQLLSQSMNIPDFLLFSDCYWHPKYFGEQSKLTVAKKMMVEDFHGYLPDDILVKSDRATMAVGLEARMPFLDHGIIEFAFALPESLKFHDGKGKFILRNLLNRYIDSNLFDRPKKGFSVPLADWLRGPLREWSESLLAVNELQKHDFFDVMYVRNKWSEHLKGKHNFENILWPILMFQSWYVAEQSEKVSYGK